MTSAYGAQLKGHIAIIPPRIGTRPPRAAAEVLAHFRKCSACDVTDAVGRLYSMDAGIRPLYTPIRRAAGIALTVKAVPGDNLTIHGALGMVDTDDFLVVDWRGHTESCGTGALSLVDPIRRGLAGVVCDGAWRDVPDIAALDLPVHGRGISPFSPGKAHFGEINVPVACGGVIVEPGDIVVADEGGVAVVPYRHVAEVAAAVAECEEPRSLNEYPLDELSAAAAARRQRMAELFTELHGVRAGEVGA